MIIEGTIEASVAYVQPSHVNPVGTWAASVGSSQGEYDIRLGCGPDALAAALNLCEQLYADVLRLKGQLA